MAVNFNQRSWLGGVAFLLTWNWHDIYENKGEGIHPTINGKHLCINHQAV